MKKHILIFSTLICLSITTVNAKELSIQQRLAKLEKMIKQPAEDRNNVADLVIQNQTLQQQIAELKGVIEEQNHQIQNLKEKQKLLYIDVDSRLTELESETTVATVVTAQTAKENGTDISSEYIEIDESYNSSAVTIGALEEERHTYCAIGARRCGNIQLHSLPLRPLLLVER